MSLEKSIKYGKDKRQKYRGANAVDKKCRNHGGCPWCLEDRTHKYKLAEEKSDDKIKEYELEKMKEEF